MLYSLYINKSPIKFKRVNNIHHLLNILNIIKLFIFNLLFHIDVIGHNLNKRIFFNYEKK